MTEQARVLAKQPNSKMCLVCGLENLLGLRAEFYELDGGQLAAVFHPQEAHQGYPGRLHGGIATALMDETIGRAIRLQHGDAVWGVTTEIRVKFRRPAPLDRGLTALARLTKETRRHFEGEGSLLLPDGSVAVQATGKYFKVPLENIADFDFDDQAWKVSAKPDDPASFPVHPAATPRSPD